MGWWKEAWAFVRRCRHSPATISIGCWMPPSPKRRVSLPLERPDPELPLWRYAKRFDEVGPIIEKARQRLDALKHL